VFGGYNLWEFSFTDLEPDLESGHDGYLVAADLGKRVSESITVGVGAWYNPTNEYSVDAFSDTTDPFLRSDIQHRFKRTMYSVYGSVFYKVVGIQAGIVPVSIQQTTTMKATGAITSADDGGQVDATLFGVLRMGGDPAETLSMSIATGFGIQRYGARSANAGTGTVAASPSSIVPTIFANFTYHVYRGLSIDTSIWMTLSDEEAAYKGIGNRSQTRVSIGAGYQF
jgi:hypothetical protein